jgi:hypothetical protein
MHDARHLGQLSLPLGEEADWGMFGRYADLKELTESLIDLVYPIDNRLGISGRCIAPDSSVGSLSLWAVRRFGRAGVRERGQHRYN